MSLNRSKLIAILTGIISLLLGIAYLSLAQLLDFRGEMLPAPQGFPGTPPLGIEAIATKFGGTDSSV